ncbi:MAG: hypothetical protein ACTSSG_14070 [Candidatus Heimdallarchaeaceae archaeon]
MNLINNIVRIISLLIANWMEGYYSQLKHQQTELIVEMSNLTLETTEIQIILNNILPKIQKRTGVHGIGVFIKDFNEFTLIQEIGLDEEIERYYSSPDLEITNLQYYNTPNKIDEVEFSLYPNHYGFILPIGSTNLMLGFLLVISKSPNTLTESNIHFLRIVANQLFLTLQRKRLLDDIQQITQTSEFSSFPVILVNDRFEIIYLNKQAEKTFDLNHEESIGWKLDHSLKLDPQRTKLIWQKIKSVITNIAKDSLKLEIDVSQLGKTDTRTFFIQLSPTINNLTGEYCVVLSLVDISEATRLQSIAEEYSNRSRMYLNVLTHDIYNILFGISGYYELLYDKTEKEDIEIVGRVNRLVKRGTAIVQDIRLLSNVLDTSAAVELNFIPLKMTVETVIEKIKEEHYERVINIDLDIPAEVKVIAGSFLHEMFCYIFNSLIEKSTEETTKLKVTGNEIEFDEKLYFVVKVIDKEGTPPQLKEEIKRALSLSPFDETIRKYLGFIIVNEIAKKYNFLVSFEDVDEEDWRKGTVISIQMPISS